jgi:hypothetical protein
MTDAITIRVTGADGLLSVIPVVIGFHPVDSLVVACLQGEQRRLGPVARVELDDYYANPQELADRLAFMVRRHAEHVIVVFYGLAADEAGFSDMLRDHGLEVLDTVFADNTAHELDLQAQAENIGRGKVVEADREALRARVEFNRWSAHNIGADSRAALYLAMTDSTRRDRYLAANIGRAVDVLPAVLAACRRIPDPAPDASAEEITAVANLCATAAFLAYRLGDGPFAQICLDRALRVHPDHQLSHLLIQAMELAITPDALDELVQSIEEPVVPVEQ